MKNHLSPKNTDKVKRDPTLNGLVDLTKNLTKSPTVLLNLYCDRSAETYSSDKLQPEIDQLNQDIIAKTKEDKKEILSLKSGEHPNQLTTDSGNGIYFISLPLLQDRNKIIGNLLLIHPSIIQESVDQFRNKLNIILEQILLVIKNKEQVRDYQLLLKNKEKIEEKLKKEAKNNRKIFKKKSRLLAHVSHEIRTPLHGIIGLTNQLKDTPLNEEQRLIIDNLSKSERILMNLVNDVLDFSKLNSSGFSFQFKPAYVHQILLEVMELYEPLAREKNIILEKDVSVSSPVLVDILRLKQVLSNMLNNALKFTPSGKIILRAKVIREQSHRRLIRFEIEDTGIGVSEDFKDRIYQEYSQKEGKVKSKGTGLGLAISKTIIKKFEGDYGLISPVDPGNKSQPGAIFWFTLPLEITDQSPIETKKVITHGLAGHKVLFIDDDQIVAMVGEKMLEKEGLIPELANSAEQAAALLDKHHFDFIFSDINLPGKSGLEIAKSIRQNYKLDIPIVCVSAYHDSKFTAKAQKAGFTHFINKPFNQRTLKKLLAKLEEALKPAET